jgi:hypothetical protein
MLQVGATEEEEEEELFPYVLHVPLIILQNVFWFAA